MHWSSFCKQSVTDGRVLGLVKGLLEVQLSTEEWTLPLFGKFTGTLHEEDHLSGVTARQKRRLERSPGQLLRHTHHPDVAKELACGTERCQRRTDTLGDKRGRDVSPLGWERQRVKVILQT